MCTIHDGPYLQLSTKRYTNHVHDALWFSFMMLSSLTPSASFRPNFSQISLSLNLPGGIQVVGTTNYVVHTPKLLHCFLQWGDKVHVVAKRIFQAHWKLSQQRLDSLLKFELSGQCSTDWTIRQEQLFILEDLGHFHIKNNISNNIFKKWQQNTSYFKEGCVFIQRKKNKKLM